MTEKQKQEIKKVIERKMKMTISDIKDFKEMSGAVAPDDAIGRVSRMDAINNKSVTEAALREAEGRLKNLEYALKRLEQEDFDQCINCGQEIQFDRLRIMPENPFCISCARKR